MNTQTSQNLMKEKLEAIIRKEPKTIKALVAKEALDYSSENITDFFDDLFRYGCISGMVTSLIYYVDTHKFYDSYYYEIEKLREYYEEQTGQSLIIDGDLKNFMSWFAFEQTANDVTNELGLEI